MTRRIWLIAAIALLAACGDDDDLSAVVSTSSSPASTAQATVPVATTTTTTMPVPATTARAETSVAGTEAVPTTSAPGCAEAPGFDLDAPLRDQFVGYLASCGFTQPEAACLFDHLDFEDPAVLAGDPDAMTPAFQECRIDVERMAEIGGT